MLFILYEKSGVYSGRALRSTLEKMYDGEVKGGYPSRLNTLLRKGSKPVLVVNLGSTQETDFDGTIMNPRDMVRAASNKKKARTEFQESGVPAPPLFLKASQVGTKDLPVIGRTSYHKKGRGFWFCKTKKAVSQALDEGATHFLGYISPTREFRVHLFSKKGKFSSEEREPEDYVSVKLSEKVWQGEGKPKAGEPQKNHDFGWVFLGPRNRRAEELDVVRYAAKQAMAALDLDFGAVDVMYKVRTKQPYVLEVNSTPSLADDHANTCEIYAGRIMKMLEAIKKKG